MGIAKVEVACPVRNWTDKAYGRKKLEMYATSTGKRNWYLQNSITTDLRA